MRPAVAGVAAALWAAAAAAAPAAGKDREVTAVRVDRPPIIDGRLDDAVWALAKPAGDFVQQFPVERATPTEKTEFRVLYDDDNLYIGVSCYDSDPDGIVARLTRRDRDIEADWVAITIDSRHSHDSAVLFQLSAAGVEVDGQFTNDSNFSYEWDGVWDGASAIGRDGWTAEFRIPLTQLRFSAADEQTWGIQVHRGVSRKHERSMWVFVPERANTWVSSAGHVVGIRGLKPRRTFELRPYGVARARGRTDDGFAFLGAAARARQSIDVDAGADLKLGLTSRLTLDATVNPDFGQVEADQVVLNLTRFETFFPEKRPFFLEGRDVFETPFNQFYPRRIGAPRSGLSVGDTYYGPGGPRTVVDLPGPTRIYGAAKLTGNATDHLTIAGLAAVTGPESVTLGGETDDVVRVGSPRSYGVVRARYHTDAGTIVGMTATGTTRLGDDGYLATADHDAYTQGADAWWLSDDARFRLVGALVLSERVGGPTYHDATGVPCTNPDADVTCVPISRADGTRLAPGDVGVGGGAHLDYRGEDWELSSGLNAYSSKLDLNDIGFLQEFHKIVADVTLVRKVKNPASPFLDRYTIDPYAVVAMGFDGSVIDTVAGVNTEMQYKNSFYSSQEINIRPPGTWDPVETYDGGHLARPAQLEVDFRLRSNASEALWWRINATGQMELGAPGKNFIVSAGAYWQVASNVELSLEPEGGVENHRTRFYDCSTASGRSCLVDDGTHHYHFGLLDADYLSLTLRGTYTFTTRLSVSAYAQLFAARGHWHDFHAVDTVGDHPYVHRGDLVPSSFTGDFNGDGVPDNDFETGQLNLNVVGRWEPMLGTTLFVVYTRGMTSNFYDVRKLDRGPAADVFLIKFVFFLS
jgi:hypothetical protein